MADPDYFTLDALRSLPNMGDVAKYPDARVLSAAAHITATIEREVGTSFVARTKSGSFDGGSFITLGPFAQAVTAVTENGASVATNLCHLRAGILRRKSGSSFVSWASGLGNVTVTWQDYYSTTPPADVAEIAMQGTRAYLLSKNENNIMSARETGIQTDSGGVINYAIAGPDRPTGFPEVDAVIIAWRDRLNVFGFA